MVDGVRIGNRGLKNKGGEMKRVYVAGAYSANDVMGVLENIRRGIEKCAELISEGIAPFCPWLDYQFSFFKKLTKEDYYNYSLAWLEVSDEVFVLSGWEKSVGTIKEIKRAIELNIPVVYEHLKPSL